MNIDEIRQEILQYIRFNIGNIQEKISKCLEKNADLFEEDNNYPLKEDKDQWNEEYIALLLVKIRKNFSKKKLNHLIEVRDYIRGPIEIQEIKKEEIKKEEIKKEEIKKEDSLVMKLKKFIFKDKKYIDVVNKDKKSRFDKNK